MKRIRVLLISILLIASTGLGCVGLSEEASPESGDITIGALLPLTGNLESIGQASQTALEESQEDVNGYFSGLGSEKNVEIVVKDTESDPETALEKLRELDEMGIKIVIGPQASEEAEAVLEYATENGIVLISTASTAPSLAIPDDNLYRFVPDDTNQGAVLATLMGEDNVTAVVPVYRDDVWGSGLTDEVKKNFEDRNGTFLEGVVYDADNENLSTEIEKLNDEVTSATTEYGNENVAVFLASYSEATEIFSLAQDYSALSDIKWYGSDGIALNEELIRDNDSAAFAAEANIMTPIYGYEEENDRYMAIESRVEEKLGRLPETYALAAYDALWIATFVDLDSVPESDESIRLAMNTLTDTYFGVTGWTKLDENGDRENWDYDIWTISETDSGHQWERAARYQVDPGEEGKLIFVE
ncbi:ABC transporter substrate-binding protein [Methanolobus zinderi]|uniref:ABC transporter substrate-binding protein n=1 Tax=Methanolobus zinderi TaxID=536044 RepID=A0A7D5I484_9EURY|nr:ABC transporter substrate-binding protein [Methanolobus zinderi]QLC49403.1 ABC transporter substrate-binding protein [Methanolobus zinderi]